MPHTLAAPVLQQWLFENPWPVVAVLGLAAAVLLMRGLRRGERRPMLIAAVLAALAGGVFLAATLVTTDRERIMAGTYELIDAAEPVDLPRLNLLFVDPASVTGPNGEVFIASDNLPDRIDALLSRRPITSHAVRNLTATTDAAGRGQTEFDAITFIDPGGSERRILSKWRLHWRRGNDNVWRIQEAQWLELNKQPARGFGRY